MRAFVAVIASLAGCASSQVGSVRFANAPPVWQVDDRRDVATQPRVRPFRRYSYHFDSYYLAAMRGLNLTRERRALGVNSMDEVPDSTWFTNRIGVRELTPDEIRRGPGLDSPELHRPWKVLKLKTGGTATGFLIEDSRGVKFLLKSDRLEFPELESGADAIVSRLLWAAGYNVPTDHVVYFDRSDLEVKAPLDPAVVDRQLERVRPPDGGKIRARASAFIEGKLLGGTPRLGTRADDPNDRIPHELRRDQRGQAALMAWLAHTDIKEDNTLDVWQRDPRDPSVHYVVHYLVDFDAALGADAALTGHLYLEHQHEIDPAAMLESIGTLGLAQRPWEGRAPVGIRGVGLYSDRDYDPGTWKANTPGQLPVKWADRFDQFWGAKIAMRFTREQLAAAVDAARFSDPRAARYMLDALVARQRRTAGHWFRRVNPLDDFAVAHSRVCFTDLALHHQLERTPTTFTATTFDHAGRRLAEVGPAQPDDVGRACLDFMPPAADRYTILRIASSRGLPPVLVHVAARDGALRIVGIRRE